MLFLCEVVFEVCVKLLKMDEASSQQVLVRVFVVENCIVCFDVSNDVISGYSRLE